jgi:tRNA G37 N-methylase TrmD
VVSGFKALKDHGFKANYFELASGDRYWISGPRKDKDDRLYGGGRGVLIDDDVRIEYQSYLRGI